MLSPSPPISAVRHADRVVIDPTQITIKNTAAVIVTATLPPFIQPGARIDVTVSSIGDAKTLQGGLLVLTSLNTDAAELKQFHHRLLMSSPRATANSLTQPSGASPPPALISLPGFAGASACCAGASDAAISTMAAANTRHLPKSLPVIGPLVISSSQNNVRWRIAADSVPSSR